MLASTTSAFNGEPSWNVIPGRSVIVHTVMSVLGVTDCGQVGLGRAVGGDHGQGVVDGVGVGQAGVVEMARRGEEAVDLGVEARR